MKTFDKYRNVIGGVVFFLFGLFYYVNSFGLKNIGKSVVNTDFFPRLCGIAMMSLSLILIVLSVMRLGKYQEKELEPFDRTAALRVFLSVVLLVIYIALMRKIGFLIMSILYVFFQVLVLTPRDEWKPIKFAVYSIVFSGVVYFAFLKVFQVLLPGGLLR